LIYDYGSLHREFRNLEFVFVSLGKEKEDLKKSKHKKAQRFHLLLHTKLHDLRH
jgi:hypothetical protein